MVRREYKTGDRIVTADRPREFYGVHNQLSGFAWHPDNQVNAEGDSAVSNNFEPADYLFVSDLTS